MKNAAIHIHASKIRLGCIIIQGALAIDQEQLDYIEKISEQDKRSLFLTFFAKLDREEYLFQLNQDFSDPMWLRIQETLYVDDLTRSDLIGQMKRLNTKFVKLSYELNEALDIIPPITNETQVYT